MQPNRVYLTLPNTAPCRRNTNAQFKTAVSVPSNVCQQQAHSLPRRTWNNAAEPYSGL